MRDLVMLFVHLIATVARLLGRGGARAVVAESLLLKHQLLILNRPRVRAPNLRPIDRIIAGLCAGLMRPCRLLRSAIVLQLDQIPFWSARDLERTLLHFRDYYNRDRVHASLRGATPACKAADISRRVISLSEYQWPSHCRGLYQFPVAA